MLNIFRKKDGTPASLKRNPQIDKSDTAYFANKMTNSIIANNKIDSELYTKYNVKRGLRNANGTGVIVGLTKISDVVGYELSEEQKKIPCKGKLYYRGYDIEDIVVNCVTENRFGFEEVAYLLLFGELPNQKRLDDFKKLLGAKRELPPGFARDMILTTPSQNIMNKLARSVLALYCYDDNPDDISIQNILRQCIDLIGYFPALISYAYMAKLSFYDNRSLHLYTPRAGLSTAENILRMIRPTGQYTKLEARLLDICLILHAEHGAGNNSSFTTHVISSSGTDTYAAISAAVGSLKGPKHGGANLAVTNMIDEMKQNIKDPSNEKEIRNYITKLLKGEAGDRTGLVYGMGHAIYTLSDPRAELLKRMAKRLAESKGLIDDYMLCENIERLTPDIFRELNDIDTPMCANVDLYSGFVYQALDIPTDISTPLFATARLAGWSAHRVEELTAGNKLIRPANKCVQPHRDYVSIKKRKG